MEKLIIFIGWVFVVPLFVTLIDMVFGVEVISPTFSGKVIHSLTRTGAGIVFGILMSRGFWD